MHSMDQIKTLLRKTPHSDLPGNDVEIHSETTSIEHVITTKARSSYIPSLDGIRALSFLLVFVSHAGLGAIIPGGFGVTIFFFLSGYLITTLLRIEFDQNLHISLRNFYIRRALRIFPPFYFILGFVIILTLTGIVKGIISPAATIAQITYLNNYYTIISGFDGQAPGTGIYWSLAIEEHFYLIFPAVYLILRRYIPERSRQVFLLLGICAAILIWRCVLVYGLHSPENRTYLATDTRIDSIIFGCILAIYGNPILDDTKVSSRQWLFLWLPFGIFGLIISLIYRDAQFRETLRYTIQGIALFPLFVAGIRYHDRPLFKILNLRSIKFLGTLSYSLYLIHFIVLSGISQFPDIHPIAQGLIALILSVLIATLIYYGIEKPCARLKKRLTARRKA